MTTKINSWFQHLYERKLLFFAFLALWLSLEYVLLGPFSYIPIFDNADSYFPEFLALRHETGIQLWYRFIGGGVDRLSQEMSYLNIFQMVSHFIPVWLTYQFYVFQHYFLSSYFTYRLCRKQLNLSETASVIAGVIYAFYRPETMILILVGIDLFPLILLCFDSIYEKSKDSVLASLWTIPLGILTAATAVVSVGTPFMLAAIPLWVVFVRRQYDLRALFLYLLLVFTVVLCQFQVIWSLILNGAFSQRIEAGYIMPKFTKVNWDFFMDALLRIKWSLGKYLPLFLTALAILYSRFKDRNFNRIFSLLLLTAFSAVVVIFIKVPAMKYLGVFSGFNFDRIYVVTPLFYAICSAYAFEYLPKEFSLGSRRWHASKVLVTLVAIVIFAQSLRIKKDNFMVWLRSGNYVSSYFSPKMLKLVQENKGPEPFRVATVSSAILPDYANTYGLETADGYPPIYSGRYYRFWGKVIEPLMNKDPYYKRYFTEWGTRIYLFPPENRPTLIVFKDNYSLNLLSLANTKYLISRSKLEDRNLVAVSEIEKPFYSLSTREMVKVRLRENFNGNDYFYIYENKTVFPRFFLANKAKVFSDHHQLLQAMGDASLQDLRQFVFTEKGFLSSFGPYNLNVNHSNIKVLNYSSDHISLEVDADGSGILVVSNTYSPFWKVTIDDQEGKIFPVYDAFWGVQLRQGKKQKIKFYYAPPYRLL